MDGASAQREGCRALDKAPRDPVAGISTVAMYCDKLQAGLLFLDDIVALRAMDVFSQYPSSIPVRAKNPQEVWDAVCS